LTVWGTSGSLKHTASTTLLINLAAPTTLTATATNSEISLAWTASTGASGYHVKRATVTGGPYVGVGCPASNSFSDSNLVKGTTYHYLVSADYTGGPDAGGESADSSEASATAE
jgi:cellulose 1,4-beta-cellobiosidase